MQSPRKWGELHEDPVIHCGEWRGSSLWLVGGNFNLGVRSQHLLGQGARTSGIFTGDLQRATQDWLANERGRDELSIDPNSAFFANHPVLNGHDAPIRRARWDVGSQSLNLLAKSRGQRSPFVVEFDL